LAAPVSRLASDGRGYYAPDTLSIAISAVARAKNSFDAFRFSQNPSLDRR
jgi:hypothetical protein